MRTRYRKSECLVALFLFWLWPPAPAAAQASSDWDLLRQVVLVPGISGREAEVMDWIQARLPKGVEAKRDAKNNLYFTAGQGRPHLLFVAHADELGMTVESLTPQGTVRLRGRGGFLPQACEARPFVIHTSQGPVEGVMLPRPDFDARAPKPFSLEPYELYLGASSEAEAKALGVAAGDPVIFKKKIADLGPGVMATRAVDDRAGCASLLAAALAVDWPKLRGRTVTCAWSVEEEVGLNGAAELAKTMKPDYVFHRHLRLDRLAAREQKVRLCPAGRGGGPPGSGQLEPRPQGRIAESPELGRPKDDPRPGGQLPGGKRRVGFRRRGGGRHPPLLAGGPRPFVRRESRPPRPGRPDRPHPGGHHGVRMILKISRQDLIWRTPPTGCSSRSMAESYSLM